MSTGMGYLLDLMERREKAKKERERMLNLIRLHRFREKQKGKKKG